MTEGWLPAPGNYGYGTASGDGYGHKNGKRGWDDSPLVSIISIGNGILAGFRGNVVWFSEPFYPGPGRRTCRRWGPPSSASGGSRVVWLC